MLDHTYEVAKGQEVPTQFHGKEVALKRAQTVAEAISSGQFENEEAVMAAATSQWLIAARAAIRSELGRTPVKGKESEFVAPTLESASAAGNAVKLGAPREHKEPKPKTEKGIAQAAARTSGNRLFEKARGDAKFLQRMTKDGIIDETEYAAWLKVNPVVEAPTA